MPKHNRVFPALLLTLAVPGCFSPLVEPIDSDTASGTETTTEGSSTDPTASTSTDPDSSSGAVDSTGAVDTPPEITAFTVDGSTMPAEQQLAGLVAFDVDATDDVGIDRVEFYDGGELVATATSSPYRTEVLVSSADNGSHSYTAVVFDTIGQTDESEVVPMSVNVIGGEILELRDNIGDTSGYLFVGFPRLTTEPTGDLLVTMTSVPDVAGIRGLAAARYTPSLSLLWEQTISPPAMTTRSASHAIVTTGGELLVGGMRGDPMDDMVLFHADAETGAALGPVVLAPTGQDIVFPVAAQLLTGEIVLSPEPHVLEARTQDLMNTLWTQPQFGGTPDASQVVRGIVGIDVDDESNVLLTFVPSDSTCGSDNAPCIRKLSPEGTTLWTRPAAGNNNQAVPLAARFGQDGRAITAWIYGEDITMQIYESDGSLAEDLQFPMGDPLLSLDFAIDAQGGLLMVGVLATNGELHPWAARLNTSGDVLWSRLYDDELPPGGEGSVVSGVVTNTDGRAFVAGAAQAMTTGILEFEAVAWIAEIDL